MAHYHRRSNIESTFSAIKRKFGESLRSKTDRAMKNEALAKVVTGPLFTVVGLAFSADGKRLVYATTDKPGTPNLWPTRSPARSSLG